jgi:hypothetical protein
MMRQKPRNFHSGNFSLKTLLIGPYLLIFLAVGLILLFSYFREQKAIIQKGDQVQNEITIRIKEHLENFIASPIKMNQLNLITFNETFQDLDNQDRLAQYFFDQVKINDSITSIYFGNTQGEIVGSGREGAAGEFYI